MCVSMQSENGMQREERAVETIRLVDRHSKSYSNSKCYFVWNSRL
jgi:hypothetical protein